MIETHTFPWTDWQAVASRWSELAERGGASFFLTPLWVRAWLDVYGESLNPTLVVFSESGTTIGACLIVRRLVWRKFVPMRRAYVNCAGEKEEDSTCIEYNRVLCAPGRDDEVATALRRWLGGRGWDELALEGFEAVSSVVSGCTIDDQTESCHYVDLARLRATGAAYDSVLSSNTRQHIRRSIRLLEEASGSIAIEYAHDAADALRFFDELAVLHQKSWTERGKPGVFESDMFRRFHQRLIADGFEEGRTHLTRVTAGGQTVGVLYGFCHGGRYYFYQSGFAYQSDNRARPGLVTHFLVIKAFLADRPDIVEYDFLAGDSQYKRSLAQQQRRLHWIVAQRPTLRARTIGLLQRIRWRVQVPETRRA